MRNFVLVVGLLLSACSDSTEAETRDGGVFVADAHSDATLERPDARVFLDASTSGDATSEDSGGGMLRFHTVAEGISPPNGPSFLRVVTVFAAPKPLLAAVRAASGWQIQIAEADVDLADARLTVFPDPRDLDRAEVAVWRIPRTVAVGSLVELDAPGGQHFALPIERERSTLGRVRIQPVVVRAADGTGGPTRSAAAIGAEMNSFAPYFLQQCQLALEVAPPAELRVADFEHLAEQDFLALDDEEAIELVRRSTGVAVGSLISLRLEQLFDAADAALGADRAIARAFVFYRHQSDDQANTLSPALYHLDRAPQLFGIPPYYLRLPTFAFDPTRPLIDHDVDPAQIAQVLVEFSGDRARRTFHTFFGDDHTFAFGHELGHLLGLPHPGASTVIDSTTVEPNLMDAVDSCVPGCGLAITADQCEVMLSGLTEYVTD